MHILKTIKSYLYDQNYVVNIYDNYLYLFNYVELKNLSDTNLKIKFEKFDLEVTGNNFLIYKMTDKEMLIKGSIDNVRFIRWEIL